MLSSEASYFLSYFQNPSGSAAYLAIAIGLAIGFGAVWLACYWPPLAKKPWLWAVLVGTPFLTLAAISFIQISLQTWYGNLWSQDVVARWVLLIVIPSVLISGLVQEGAKMVPVVVYWGRSGRNIDAKLGLIIGAVAGAGFGVFEAQYFHNLVFASGWTWATLQTYGFAAILPFWERFFVVASHIAFSALAGYGLAKGRGWQFYLIASVLHAVLNYGAVLYQTGHLSPLYTEIYVAGIAAAVTALALWLRWRKKAAPPEAETLPGEATMAQDDSVAQESSQQ
jgi:RsiW-degrading membrane proteinase PrsW (M82 family)